MSIPYFNHDKAFASFVELVHKMTDPQLARFISDAIHFQKKGIPPQFVTEHIHLVNESDFTQDGLAVFCNFEGKKCWLEYCGNLLVTNPHFISQVTPFFNEALSLPPIDKIYEIAFSTLKTCISRLCENNNFLALQKIIPSINGASGILSEIDKKGSTLKFIVQTPWSYESSPFFKESLAEQFLPHTFKAAIEAQYIIILATPDPIEHFTKFYGLIGILPSEEALQIKYLDLLTKYAETLDNDGYDDD